MYQHPTNQTEFAIPFYDRALIDLDRQFASAHQSCVDRHILSLAHDLVSLGKVLDFHRTGDTISNIFNRCVQRDPISPPSYTSMHIISQSWADRSLTPLEDNEQWNAGRRASNTGVTYALTEDNLPINPFFNYGINGRGIIGRYGPNHAVDIAPCRMMVGLNGESNLHVLGIIRGDTMRPAICGGFVDFTRAADGTFPYPRRLAISSQLREFFEEVISGSIPLLAPYALGLEDDIEHQLKARARLSGPLTAQQEKTIRDQEITHRKWIQIRAEDPSFLINLHRAIAQGQDCYAGPVLSSSRNTNNAWMETRLSWFHLDEAAWTKIKGKNQKFAYDFVAGDDAQDALWHEISADLVSESSDHGAFFCYILASYMLLNPQSAEPLKKQAENLVETLPQKIHGLAPRPQV